MIILFVFYLITLISSQTPFSGPAWQHQTAVVKNSILKPTITNNTTPGSYPTDLQLAELFLEDMSVTFDTVADDMPYQFIFQRRPKLIHSVVVIIDAVWKVVPNSLGYTGVFSSGCSNAFVRLSLASAPANATGGFTPGISFKCLRNQVPSGNIMALFSLEGQDSWNFFLHDLTNHVPDLSANAPLALQEIRSLFAAASAWPVMLGTSSLAIYDENGTNITKPAFPFRLVFHPTTALHKAFPNTPSSNFAQVLVQGLQIPQDLYYVYAVPNPNDPPQNFVHIATITGTSSATTSNFGDVLMFFEHTRMESDFVFRPDWATPATQIMAYQRAQDHFVFPDLPFN
jgi:hypothetical protein